jgi:hypothetical protein
MKNHSLENMPNLVFEDETNTTLVLSEDCYKAANILIQAELFDRTFLILVIFCVSWYHTSMNAVQRKLDEDERGIENLNIYSMADVTPITRAIRLFVSSTLGVLFIDLMTLYFQKNLFNYQMSLMRNIALIFSLAFYMYLICK